MVNKNAYDGIFGNDVLKKTFIGFTEKSAFPNSVIISGKKGSGKFTFAVLEAMSISCRGDSRPCLECESCRKISSGISPDVMVISPQKDRKTIGIEAVRSIRETVYIAPNDLDSKFYIIKDADLMTVQAQNALLKLFEEPPSNVYFILLCSSASGLLTTVRSRAPELRTELFSASKMRELLLSHSKKAKELYDSDRENFERVIHLAEGSYGEALRLIKHADKKLLSGFSSAINTIKALSGGKREEFITLVLNEASSRDNLAEFFGFMNAAVRDMTAAKKVKGEVDLMFFPKKEDAYLASVPFTFKELLDINSALQKAQEDILGKNVNIQTAALFFANMLWRIK